MEQPALTQESNYRWVVAATLFLVYTLVMGLGSNVGSLYIVPVTEYYGFSRGDFSLLFTLITAANATFQAFYGTIARRIGVRRMMIIGVILAPLAYLVFSRASSLPVFYAGAVIFGVSMALSALTSVSILVSNWFSHNQGMVLGVISAGSGVGGAAASLVIGSEIARNGFQSAYLLAAGLLAIPILPVILLIKNRSGEAALPPGGRSAAAAPPPAPMSQRQFLRSPILMPGILVIFLIGFTIYPVATNTPAFMVEKGYSQLFAAGIYSGLMLVLAAGKIGLGFIHDRLGLRASLAVGVGANIVAAAFLLLTRSEPGMWAYVIFQGTALATLSILVPLFARALLGKDNYSSYLGFYVAMMNTGAGIGMPAMNYLYDLTHTYAGSQAAYAGLAGVALLLTMLVLDRANQRKAEPQAAGG